MEAQKRSEVPVRLVLDVAPGTLVAWLIAIATGLLAMDVLLQVLHYRVGEVHWLLKDAFDVDEEQNIPTWFSAAALMLAAGLLFVIAGAVRRARSEGGRHWWGLAGGFVFLSLDEVAGIHEIVNTWVDEIRDDSKFTWAYYGAAIAGIVGLIYVRFLSRLPVATRRLFYTAGALYVSGVVGMELAGHWYLRSNDIDSLAYNVLAAVEEGLEMAGVILFIYALLDFMKSADFKSTETESPS